jgi:hypothetical protein
MGGNTGMDFWIPMALAVLFELLKKRGQAAKYEAALFKLHGAIEALYPQLKTENRANEEGQRG